MEINSNLFSRHWTNRLEPSLKLTASDSPWKLEDGRWHFLFGMVHFRGFCCYFYGGYSKPLWIAKKNTLEAPSRSQQKPATQKCPPHVWSLRIIRFFTSCLVLFQQKNTIMKPINTATVRNHSLNPEFLPQELLRFPQILCRLFHTLWPLVFCCFKNSLPLSPFWFPTPSSSIAGKTRHQKPWEKTRGISNPQLPETAWKNQLGSLGGGGFFFGLGENSSSFGWGFGWKSNPSRSGLGFLRPAKPGPRSSTQFKQ